MKIKKKAALAGIAALVVAAGLAAAAGTSNATTLTCTHSLNATTSPIGCGGYRLAYAAKGTLDLAVLGTGSTSGNYWNSPVGFQTESLNATRQDFTVFAVNGKINTGPGFLGSYVVMYTPDGTIPTFTGVHNGVTGTYTNSTPDINTSFAVGANVYCLSVENLNDGPGHTLRWHVVLRNCNTNGQFHLGDNKGSQNNNYNSVSFSHANRYQVWSPVSGATGLTMINLSLSNDHPHGFNKSNTPYVLDDRGFGGSGSQALAFPENDGANQQGSILGCTDPIISLNTGYQLCP